jgi:hypothetical protein
MPIPPKGGTRKRLTRIGGANATKALLPVPVDLGCPPHQSLWSAQSLSQPGQTLPDQSPSDQSLPEQPEQSDPPELALAQRALESGDYGTCLRSLAPLAEAHGASTALGSESAC